MLKAQQEDRERAEVHKITTWARDHRVKECNLMNAVGKCVFPTSWLELPGDLAARELQSKNTSVVDKSILKMGKNDEMTNVEVVVWSDELLKYGLNPQNIQLDTSKPKPADLHFRAIVGANTITSIGRLHKARPNNIEYQTIHVTLLVCERNVYNTSMGKAYGQLENKIRNARTSSTTWDLLYSIHNSYLNISNQFSEKSQFKKAWVAEKALLKVSNDDSSQGAFDQNVTIAMKTGAVWELIQRIFKNEVEPLKSTGKVPAAPKGIGHFKFMGRIPEAKLEEWLHKVVEGDEETKHFAVRCNRFKQKAAVKLQIIQFIETVRDRTGLTWDDIKQDYPSVAEPRWLETVLEWVGSVNAATLNTAIKDDILKKIEHDEREQEEEEELSSTQVYVLYFLFRIIHYFLLWLYVYKHIP